MARSPRRGAVRARHAAGIRLAALPLALAALALAPLVSCSDDGASDSGPAPLFPADYASSYTEVRDCRSSTEHEFAHVRVLADPQALGAYLGRDSDFPVGSIVLKEEYDIGDTSCAGDVVRWTVMQRLATGSSSATLDWSWQDVQASRRVETADEPRCIGCHTTCGVPPDGYQGTCAVVGAAGEAFR
jgi:hypothetical protein